MDDFNLDTIQSSRAEWCEQFIMIVKPYIIEGFDELFREAYKLCKDKNQLNKYIITFQNFICQIPKWSQTIIDKETQRICEKSQCSYLEIILTSAHIAQLKILSAIRAGQKPKKIDIDIPSLSDFIHKIYINVGREIHKNADFYIISTKEYVVNNLKIKNNRRQIESIVEKGILETFRKTIPIDKIIRAYLEPTNEEEITEKIEEMNIYPTPVENISTPSILPVPIPLPLSESIEPIIESMSEQQPSMSLESISESVYEPENILTSLSDSGKLSFNDIDMVRDTTNQTTSVEAPKTLERLEEISNLRNSQRKLLEEEENDADKDQDILNIDDAPPDMSLSDLYDNDFEI